MTIEIVSGLAEHEIDSTVLKRNYTCKKLQDQERYKQLEGSFENLIVTTKMIPKSPKNESGED